MPSPPNRKTSRSPRGSTEALLHARRLRRLPRAALDLIAGLLETALGPPVSRDRRRRRRDARRAARVDRREVRRPGAHGGARPSAAIACLQHQRRAPGSDRSAGGRQRGQGRRAEAAIANGKMTPEDLDAGFKATPKAVVQGTRRDIDGALERAREARSRSRGTSSATLRRATRACAKCARGGAAHSPRQQLKRKLELEPDPVEAAPADGAAVRRRRGCPGVGDRRQRDRGARSPPSRRRAMTRRRASSALRGIFAPTIRTIPPSYLMLRGFRWGELRARRRRGRSQAPRGAADERPDQPQGTVARLPLAASCSKRAKASWARRKAADGWIFSDTRSPRATPSAATISPCATAHARRAARRCSRDLPHLLDMTLMDDTPTANAETRAWLRRRCSPASRCVDRMVTVRRPAAARTTARGAARSRLRWRPRKFAPGRADRAIALLMREAGAREDEPRSIPAAGAARAHHGRCRTRNGRACRFSNSSSRDIETHKLEEWEAGELVAAPMALLYRVPRKDRRRSVDAPESLSSHLSARSDSGDQLRAALIMAKREIERTVQPSLLDRLTDDDPRESADPRITLRRVARAVQGRGAARSRVAAQHAPHRRRRRRRSSRSCRDSLYNFGVPDITSLSRDSPDARPQLLRQVEDALAIFEPRLANVRISLVEMEGEAAPARAALHRRSHAAAGSRLRNR